MHYTVDHIYKSSGSTLVKYTDLDTVTVADVVTLNCGIHDDINATYVGVLKSKVTDLATGLEKTITTGVNLCKVFTITDTVKRAIELYKERMSTTLAGVEDVQWKDIGDALTDQDVMGYPSPVPDFDKTSMSLISTQILHDPAFDLHYCLLDTPEDRDTKMRRWQLLDLAVSKKEDSDHPSELENCLLSVNGCLSYPIMYNGELLMSRGAEWMHRSTRHNTPSVTLMDFGNLGKMKIVPFHECTYRVRMGYLPTSETESPSVNLPSFTPEGGIPILPGYSIEVILPDGADLSDSYVMMIYGHSLYLQNYLTIISDSSIIMSPYNLCVGESLIKSMYNTNKYEAETNIVMSENFVKEYIEDIAWRKDHHGACFVILEGASVYIKKTPLYQYTTSNMHIGVPKLDGLLWDETTHSFYDHTNLQYTKITDMYTQPYPKLSHMTNVTDTYMTNRVIEDIHPWYGKHLKEISPMMYSIEMISAPR